MTHGALAERQQSDSQDGLRLVTWRQFGAGHDGCQLIAVGESNVERTTAVFRLTRRAFMSATAASALMGAPPARAQNRDRRILRDLGLSSPETVLHDGTADVYFVSSINGPVAAKDNNGFISRMAPDGRILEAKWIEGGRNATLNGPKGMAFSGDTLYVADIDTVRIFDRRDGRALGSIVVPEATFINGLATLPNGDIVGTETALTSDASGAVSPTRNDFVFRIDHRTHVVAVIAKDPALGQPNGIAIAAEDRAIVVTRGSNELYELSLSRGQKLRSWQVPQGMLDGVGILQDGRLVASSWQGSCLYAVNPSTGVVAQFGESLSSGCANFLIDRVRNQIVMPLLRENVIAIEKLA